jgi:acyl dehydratase
MTEAAEALMPEANLTEELIESMSARAGTELRIEHSIFNEVATRLAVVKFADGIGDVNPLWTDPDHAQRSPYRAAVAPPTFVIGCFSGIQFGWPGLGSFHSSTRIRFHLPVYWHDTITPSCRYVGFDGPKRSSFAEQMVIDHFANRYTNQLGELVAEIDWDVINFERGTARGRNGNGNGNGSRPEIPHRWSEEEVAAIEARVRAEQPRGRRARFF